MDKDKYLVIATSNRARTVDGWSGDYQENDEETELIHADTVEDAIQAAGVFAECNTYYSDVYNKCEVTFSPVFKVEEVAQVDGASFYEARKAEAERKAAERLKQDLLAEARRAESQKQRELAELERLRKKYNK